MGGGIGLGEHPLDAGFGPTYDSWFGLAALQSSAALGTAQAFREGPISRGSVSDVLALEAGDELLAAARAAWAKSESDVVNHVATGQPINVEYQAVVASVSGSPFTVGPLRGDSVQTNPSQAGSASIFPMAYKCVASLANPLATRLLYYIHTHPNNTRPTNPADYLATARLGSVANTISLGARRQAFLDTSMKTVVATRSFLYVATVSGSSVSIMMIPDWNRK